MKHHKNTHAVHRHTRVFLCGLDRHMMHETFAKATRWICGKNNREKTSLAGWSIKVWFDKQKNLITPSCFTSRFISESGRGRNYHEPRTWCGGWKWTEEHISLGYFIGCVSPLVVEWNSNLFYALRRVKKWFSHKILRHAWVCAQVELIER